MEDTMLNMNNSSGDEVRYLHPISEAAVESATGTYADVTEVNMEQIHGLLATVQARFEPRLGNLVEDGLWYNKAEGLTPDGEVERPPVDFLAESRSRVFFEVSAAPWDGVLKDMELEDRQLQYIVRDAHNYEAREHFEIDEWPERLTDDNRPTAGGVLVVQKPAEYCEGENGAHHHLWWMIEHGADPEKALDYYMVAHRDFDLEHWAETRHEDVDVIETNVHVVANRFERTLHYQ